MLGGAWGRTSMKVADARDRATLRDSMRQQMRCNQDRQSHTTVSCHNAERASFLYHIWSPDISAGKPMPRKSAMRPLQALSTRMGAWTATDQNRQNVPDRVSQLT